MHWQAICNKGNEKGNPCFPRRLTTSAAPKIASRSRLCRAVKRTTFVPSSSRFAAWAAHTPQSGGHQSGAGKPVRPFFRKTGLTSRGSFGIRVHARGNESRRALMPHSRRRTRRDSVGFGSFGMRGLRPVQFHNYAGTSFCPVSDFSRLCRDAAILTR